MQTASSPPSHPVGSGPGSAPYLPPASPTLTNPDMILPDYDDTASSPDRSQSPLLLWKNAHAADMQFDLSSQSFAQGPITPTTPIIYGNGTMLSDIGEVTEVESTCPPHRSRSNTIRDDFQPKLNPAINYEAIMKRNMEMRANRERRMSIESTSTVTTNERPGLFADFDDAVSVDDSNFQGDDEESVADSYIDDASVQESMSPAREVSKKLGEERYSTALSRRAEQILANAKRRLTTMEGNLSRARTSLASPTLSMDSDSTPSPPIPRPATALYHQTSSHPRVGHQGHSRISSESNLPTENKPSHHTQRASSALGAVDYRPPVQIARNGDYMHGSPKLSPSNSIYGNPLFAKSKTSLHLTDLALEPLSEDDISEGTEPPMPRQENINGENLLSPTFGPFPDRNIKRSSSTTQMRDLKDQMADLKGRLSTLRDQARADSMKRRSLQSLRTPSPFTHARVEQWYAQTQSAGHNNSVPRDPNLPSVDGDVPMTAENNTHELESERIVDDEEESVLSGYSDADRAVPATELGPAEPRLASPFKSMPSATIQEIQKDQLDDMRTEDGYEDEDAGGIDDYGSESGESSYHDTVQNQVSHEDREDAFDYEHFFLHSAMGSMSQRRAKRRGSQDSYTSESSVETTRGPTTSPKVGSAAAKIGRRSRRGSTGSVSTIDSFATATEGSGTENDFGEEDYMGANVDQVPEQARMHTFEPAKQLPFASERSDSSSDQSQWRTSMMRRPQSSAATFMHRPSVSSFESTGTTRSFPLVNRPKINGGVLTPRDTPERELKQISESLLSETASICDREGGDDGGNTAAIGMLQKEDQILVERLVAGLGRCVLGLTESGRASAESRSYRRRIETARRVLEGLEEPM
ncbi:hypothetical protein F5Y15DRAFT_409312 [Xylariaceae sp. FL0016]|nr:hypothetical protein F5Y15DRAFT_409312 [Xylariaceae sp. FL0016]